jgi:hypothetical protein
MALEPRTRTPPSTARPVTGTAAGTALDRFGLAL